MQDVRTKIGAADADDSRRPITSCRAHQSLEIGFRNKRVIPAHVAWSRSARGGNSLPASLRLASSLSRALACDRYQKQGHKDPDDVLPNHSFSPFERQGVRISRLVNRHKKAHKAQRSFHSRCYDLAGMSGAATAPLTSRFFNQRRRIGFKTTPASSAVAKFITMMIAKTGIHDLNTSCTSAATGPPSTEPTPCAM